MNLEDFAKKTWKVAIVVLIIFIIAALVFLWTYMDDRAEKEYTFGECFYQNATLNKQYLDYEGEYCEGCLVLDVTVIEYGTNEVVKKYYFGNQFELNERFHNGDILSIRWCEVKNSGQNVIQGVEVI